MLLRLAAGGIAMLAGSGSAFRPATRLAIHSRSGLCRHSSASAVYAEMQQQPVTLFYNDIYKVNLPAKHKFPMDKYQLVRESLQSKFAGSPEKVNFQISPLATREELETTHCPDYIERFMEGRMTEKEIRISGFPWTKNGVDRSLSSVGGTLAATRHVLNNKSQQVSAHLAGGTHHAFYDRGEGFCIFSDIAVAANVALEEYPSLERVLIIDLDVHQGNGNAKLFEHNKHVSTFNMHCTHNVFSELQISDVDVELAPGTDGVEYLDKLRSWLPSLFSQYKPQLVFYQAGVDVHERDRLGKLKLTLEDLRSRNEAVYKATKASGAKLVVTMGGGYPKTIDSGSEAFENIITAHSDVYAQIVESYLD